MTNINDTDATGSRAPTHYAYAVREGKDKSRFTRIGAAWPHKSGSGFNILVDITPLNGRIVLFPADQKKD
jgi:hypothetical protein